MIPAPHPEGSLTDALAALSTRPASAQALATLSQLGVPAADFLSTLLSARIGLMGAQVGLRFVHHELRRRLPFPEGLGPEVAVWDGQTVPEWREGVLETPKYFSFFLDTPFPAYNTNYRIKWRPHEVLHGLVTFFWSPEMTRFEAYVGARIAELLPVAHWYGYDEILRPRCPKHKGQLLYRMSCPDCEALSGRPYWETDVSDARLLDQSRLAEARAASYLATELAAINAEMDSGRRVWTHHPRLDGASDAEGYLKGHHNRLTAWSFGATVEHFLVAGVDYQDTVAGLRDNMLSVQSALLHDPLSFDAETAERRYMRRVLRDLGYRTFVALEWLDEGSAAEDGLMPIVEAAAALSGELLSPGADPGRGVALVHDWLARFSAYADAFPPEVAAAFPGLALPDWPDDRFLDAGLPQVMDGIRSALPNHSPSPEHVRAFALSTAFRSAGTLRQRYGPWSGDDQAWFNGWLHDLPHRDNDAELFATLPEPGAPIAASAVRLNQTLRRQAFPASLVAAVLDADATEAPFLRADGTVEVAAVWWDNAPRIIPLDAETTGALEAIAAGRPLSLEALSPLLDAGVAIYLPPCRS